MGDLVFRNTATGSRGATRYHERLLTSTSIAVQDEHSRAGVVAIPVRPGSCELQSVSFQFACTVCRSKEK